MYVSTEATDEAARRMLSRAGINYGSGFDFNMFYPCLCSGVAAVFITLSFCTVILHSGKIVLVLKSTNIGRISFYDQKGCGFKPFGFNFDK